MPRTTSASTRYGRPTRRLSKPITSATRCTSIPAPSTAFTTTRRRAIRRRLPSSHGSGPSRSSRSILPDPRPPVSPRHNLLGRFAPCLQPERLRLLPARVQDELGVTVRLLAALEDQIAGGAERRPVETRRHRAVERIILVLPVHHAGHPFERVHHLRPVDDAVEQPIGNVLAGDAQGGAVFHQADVVDVRHLGAADALIDSPPPTNNTGASAIFLLYDQRGGA